MLRPNFERIPAELAQLPRWLVWRDKKVPYCASDPRLKASSTDPETWSSFEMARTTFEEGGFLGVGFALNNDGIVGVDLDKCVTDGTPTHAATQLIDMLQCGYVELSPSGTGLRAFGYGPAIKGTRGKLNGVNVELYSTGRYLTVTGHTLRTEAIRNLHGLADLATLLKPHSVDTHREHGEYRSNLSVLSVLSVGDAIGKTKPTGQGQRHFCLFQFARHVKALHPNAKPDELRAYAKQWHESALPFIGTKDFLVTWSEFSDAFERVRYPAGTSLSQIIGDIDMSDPIPERLVSLGYSMKSIQLFRICQRLQEQAGEEPFFLSSRQAAILMQMDFSDAAKILRVMRADGFLQEVSKGAGNRASRYRLTRQS